MGFFFFFASFPLLNQDFDDKQEKEQEGNVHVIEFDSADPLRGGWEQGLLFFFTLKGD